MLEVWPRHMLAVGLQYTILFGMESAATAAAAKHVLMADAPKIDKAVVFHQILDRVVPGFMPIALSQNRQPFFLTYLFKSESSESQCCGLGSSHLPGHWHFSTTLSGTCLLACSGSSNLMDICHFPIQQSQTWTLCLVPWRLHRVHTVHVRGLLAMANEMSLALHLPSVCYSCPHLMTQSL